ncbi:MAG: tRNA pseudouridine(55) synthase TruB [Alphaproteobacteria bacterium]
MHGWVYINKPLGMTSNQVVGKLRHVLGRKQKVGHGGTLDPLATGVLPIAIGEGTKVVQFIMDQTKAYCFKIGWGEERTTDDLEGEVTKSGGIVPIIADIQESLAQFTGEIEQIPPAYSALKVDGKRAYSMARAGEEVVLKPRKVTIESLEYDENTDTFHVVCSKGTYVRSLARDIARSLGTYGHVTLLQRTRVGKISLDDTISLEKVAELGHNIASGGYLYPIGNVLDDILAFPVNDEIGCRILKGQRVPCDIQQDDQELVLLHTIADDIPLALCELKGGVLHPKRVFNIKSY